MGKNNGDLHKLQQTNLTYNGFFFFYKPNIQRLLYCLYVHIFSIHLETNLAFYLKKKKKEQKKKGKSSQILGKSNKDICCQDSISPLSIIWIM